ncbi:MAG: PIN domain-containing protein, partial [Bacteroidales bacterium]
MEIKLKYLVDTNIWLERLLDQEKSEVVFNFLNTVSNSQIFISDFTVHSIGVILSKLNKLDTLDKFVRDLFINGQIEQVFLSPESIIDLTANIKEFNLDFDDAYQLTLSQKYDMTIVTFDKDFNAKGIVKLS